MIDDFAIQLCDALDCFGLSNARYSDEGSSEFGAALFIFQVEEITALLHLVDLLAERLVFR